MVSSVGESSGSGLITLDEEDDIPDGPVPPTVQKYIDAGVISYRDAKAIGFLSSPENAMFIALFESARQKGLKLELHRIDTQTGTFEFKIKSANEKLNGAIVALTMTAAGAGLGFTAGLSMAGRGKAEPVMENMSGVVGGGILQVFKSAGEVGEAALGVDAAEFQAFADLFEQNYQALTSEISHTNDSASATLSGART